MTVDENRKEPRVSGTPGWDDFVTVGFVARAHGNRGQVIVNPETDFPEQRFAEGAVLQVRRDGRVDQVRVTSCRLHQGRPVIGLEGVETMNDAEALAGVEFRIAPGELAELPPGSFYRHDLVGCLVETTRGDAVGKVAAVEGDQAASRLVVAGRRGEVLIPMTEAICVKIDIAARQIVVDPPEGLLELNDRP